MIRAVGRQTDPSHGSVRPRGGFLDVEQSCRLADETEKGCT